jgi:hypothetical protein
MFRLSCHYEERQYSQRGEMKLGKKAQMILDERGI